jgi:hypothetical protein
MPRMEDTEKERQDDAPEGESDANHPVPSRENVVDFLGEADREEDLDQAGYWVQRALAETMLLIHDQRA